jgi:hypothetical protein
MDKMPILWKNGLGGSGGFARIFLLEMRANPPDPPNPFFHSIGILIINVLTN